MSQMMINQIKELRNRVTDLEETIRHTDEIVQGLAAVVSNLLEILPRDYQRKRGPRPKQEFEDGTSPTPPN